MHEVGPADPQFSDQDLQVQTAPLGPVTLDAHFPPAFCFPDKTTKQIAQNCPGEWKVSKAMV